jgi:hypothetical protein
MDFVIARLGAQNIVTLSRSNKNRLSITFEIFGTKNMYVDCGILRCTTGECLRRL